MFGLKRGLSNSWPKAESTQIFETTQQGGQILCRERLPGLVRSTIAPRKTSSGNSMRRVS